ncbi:hypothetical protein BCM02_11618 [Paenibacillus methanolicus]|uniref:HPr serine kinase-like protein n=2 Tax=Paenibacillus methanolicus TaxID=582686 RepID=A0A5S5BSH8_9BACL|nr:hypothetical protein BCM02_11618 [Paenibacillus methanolicus]
MFGLVFESDFRLDGLTPDNGEPDAVIREGIVDAPFSGPEGENAFCVAENGAFAFRVKGIGAFQIRDGREITFQKDLQCLDDAYTLYISGTCAGTLLMQRGIIPIHGSALLLEGKGVIVTGDSGAGKSTLSASLNKRGCSFLADDIAALQIEPSGEVVVRPGFPQQKLWRDTATRIYGSVEMFDRIPGTRDKYYIPIPGDQFIPSNKRLHALFELVPESRDTVEIVELRGMEKLARLMYNTYRFELVELLGLKKWHFEACAQLASQIAVYRIKRPASGFTVEEQIEGMMRAVQKL